MGGPSPGSGTWPGNRVEGAANMKKVAGYTCVVGDADGMLVNCRKNVHFSDMNISVIGIWDAASDPHILAGDG